MPASNSAWMTYKPRLLFYLISLLVTSAFGQAPVITHVDKYVNGNGKPITISGTNFGANAANLSIWFGAAQATTIPTATDQTIEVLVPPGATYESISVTDKTSGLTAWSSGEFQLSYGGEHPFALANLVAQPDLAAESGLFDVCLCDLDNDGMNDVATANSGNTTAPPINSVALFRNTTPVGGSFTFAAKNALLPGIRSLHVRCGDLDGDGKKDLVVSEADPGNRVFILRNTSTVGSLSFVSQSIALSGKAPKRVEIADLDLDGRPEVIITDQKAGNNNFIILPNTSSGATITFGTPVFISGPPTGANSSDGLAVQDLDGDHKPEIVLNQFLTANSNVFVYANESTVGNFRFDRISTLTLSGTPVNVRVGDIDGDSKPDIVATQLLASQISVFLNQSTSTQLQFASPVTVTTDLVPWGLDFGDLDGDNKLDIVVASLIGSGSVNPKSITILNNTSTPGNVSFLPAQIQSTPFANRHIAIGDLDGDSKPDISYTSVDVIGTPASMVSFFRNKSCIVPKVTPDGPMVVCSSFPITLEATIAPGAVYSWKKDNVALGVATATFTPSLTGIYEVEITSDGCTKTSNTVNVMVSAGVAAAPTFSNNSPICAEGVLNLTATSAGGTTFNWTGPAGFIATGSSVSRSPYRPEFAGRYEVEIMAGGCIAAKGSTLVETISLPAFNVGFTGSDVFCTGDTKTLTVSPNDANFTYQWTDASGNIGGAVNPNFVANNSGTYSFKAKSTLYPGCPDAVAESASLILATTPIVAFTSPVETCKDTPTSFTNQSTMQADAGPKFKWEFGDAATSTDTNPTHTYTTLGNLTVKLTASYRGDACAVSQTKPIEISLPPTANITAPGNNFIFCEGDTLTLSVSPSFNEYKWSTGATTPTLDITNSGTFKVDLKDAIGCKISVTKIIAALDAPDLTASATPNSINLGEQTILTVPQIYDNYEWSPAETLDNPSGQSPVAKPTITTKYVVTSLGANGCTGRDTVEVIVNIDNPTNLLKIANFFSPNGDDTNPIWRVEPAAIVQTCGVTIFDEKGSKVYEAKPYNNDWDGTNNGKRLPDGVYYYVIRCDGDSAVKTGSITILR